MAHNLRAKENKEGRVDARGMGRQMPRGRHRLTEEQHAEIRRHFRAAFTNSTPEQVFLKFAGHDERRDDFHLDEPDTIRPSGNFSGEEGDRPDNYTPLKMGSFSGKGPR